MTSVAHLQNTEQNYNHLQNTPKTTAPGSYAGHKGINAGSFTVTGACAAIVEFTKEVAYTGVGLQTHTGMLIAKLTNPTKHSCIPRNATVNEAQLPRSVTPNSLPNNI